MSTPTYEQFVHHESHQIKAAYDQKNARERLGNHFSESDLAHCFWRRLVEHWTLRDILHDILGEPLEDGGGEGDRPSVPVPSPVPTPSGDLTSWPRRGGSLYGLLTDSAWDYDGFARILHDCGLTLTRFWLLSAQWAEVGGDLVLPFLRRENGFWDLFAWNPAYFDRLARIVGTLNSRGIVAQLDIAELYGWADRKQGLPGVPDANQGPWRHNVNGVHWADDATFDRLPDAWLTEFTQRAVQTVKGAGVVLEIGNEFPEKAFHYRLRDVIRGVWPEAPLSVNRNEDVPGQYANMRIGTDFDRISFHGKRDLGTLDEVFDNGAATDRPSTIRALLDHADGKRIIFSSDGCRASTDAVNTYDWPRLLEVFRYVAGKGCSIEHQSRAKMTRIQTGRADLGMVEVDFLKQIARL